MEKGMTIDRVIHILLARINERHGRLWRIRALFDQNEMLSVDWPRDDWDEVMELTDVAFSDGVVTQTDRKAAVRRLARGGAGMNVYDERDYLRGEVERLERLVNDEATGVFTMIELGQLLSLIEAEPSDDYLNNIQSYAAELRTALNGRNLDGGSGL